MQEGVIQYRLDFSAQALPAEVDLVALDACRSRLFSLGLIGQDDQRYAGLGYGNVSQRVALAENRDAFMITGSQTGHLPVLSRDGYALVTACEPMNNYLRAEGGIKPSSEAMTHAVVYQYLPEIQAVIHVHWPELWQNAPDQGIPVTARNIPYGTPQMATAVQAILAAGKPGAGALAMLGHEDGILFWGRTLAETEARIKQYIRTDSV